LKFLKSKLKDACIIEIEKIDDERGFFTRTWDKKICKEKGLDVDFVQNNMSLSKLKGTLRGLHYQLPPYEETKMIHCIRGSVYNVIIDLRTSSKTYMQWEGIELNEENHLIRYIPKGFANGILSLEDNSKIFYQVSQFYTPNCERGIRWDDSSFNIEWPRKIKIISKKDQSWEPFLN